ncbi:glutamate racemase [Patescibacteria group bacterium]|nr:glutamate racemase [Patescibacteria group bacterium]
MDKRPVGVFDSGLGGLTVVKEIKRVLPGESIVYLGDTARVPYGTRSKKTVEEFSLQNINFLLRKKVKCVVVACNTASAQAYRKIRKKSSVTTFDVIVPAVKAATKNGQPKVIGVIGTRGTIKSGAYKRKIQKVGPNFKVFELTCPLFVPLIEEGELRGELIRLCVDKYLIPLRKKKIDTLILGCTHYPLIKTVIEKRIGPKVKIIDSGKEVTKELFAYLTKKQMLAPENNKPRDEYFVTDLTQRFIKVAEMFLGESLKRKIKEVSVN